jgi:phi LC3 family holin
MDLKIRLRNYAFWISVASFIVLILQTFGVTFDLGQYDKVVNSVLSLLVLLGIINNPTTENKGFLDD